MDVEKLKEIKIDKTEIVEIDYISNSEYKSDNGEVHSDLPELYRIKFVSKPGDGSLISIEVWLPLNWNGIFLGTGNGGMAGNICYGALATYVRDGYAVANTDMGTSRGRNSGIGNPDVWKDFGWRSTHIMTVIGKMVIKLFYGKEPEYSYFIGGSTGGQQALSEAQRFPEDYDGIIAAAPANNRTMLHTYFLWNHNHLRKNGEEPLFSRQEIDRISECAVLYFQKQGDGEPGDNFVSVPKGETEDIKAFLVFLQTHTEFSEEQLKALEAVYVGPVNSATGKRIYNGIPIGSEAVFAGGFEDCQQEESPNFYPFLWAFGENYDGYSFDFDKDMDKLNGMLAADLNANCADLSKFKKQGGKMIMYTGSSDPCVPYPDTLNYYNRVMEQMGGYEGVQSFFRYFLMPGQSHNDDGNGTNEVWANADGGSLLDALRLWREDGQAPESLVGVGFINKCREDGIRFVRCVYPCGSKKDISKMKYPPVCDEVYLNAGSGQTIPERKIRDEKNKIHCIL